ncbi:MAG: GDSL-type esterase/lipase family protein [Pseudomonadota bacterium]
MSRLSRALTEYLGRKVWASWRTALDLTAVEGCGGVVLLGDSLTHMGRWELMFPQAGVRNFGIGGERSDHLLLRLEPVIRIRPQKLFLLIGTNDLASGLSVEAISRNVATLLDTLATRLPDCRLHLQAALPRQRKFAARIRALNARYAAMAAQRGIAFIDLYPLFDDGTGELKKELTYDRLHLMGAGYVIWRDALRPYVDGSPA